MVESADVWYFCSSLYPRLCQNSGGGGTEGILLFFRVISVCIQAAVSIYFYLSFVKGGFNKKSVLYASIVFFLFVPDFQTFCYKTVMFWMGALEIVYVYRFYLTKKNRYLVALGLAISASVLVYPTTVIELPVYLFIIFALMKNKETVQEKGKHCIKYWLIIIGTCIVCAFLFLFFVFSRCGVTDFLIHFPKVFQDENLDTSFLTKLLHPLAKYLAMGCMALFPVIVYSRIEIVRKTVDKLRLPVITILLWLAFLGQCYIERSGVTWHCLVYPYALTLFWVPVLCFAYKERIIVLLFEIPALTIVLCIAVASNQGNLVSMYGSVFAVMGFLLLLGENWGDGEIVLFRKERGLIVMSIFVFISCMSIPVWDQETVMVEHKAGSIFTPRVEVPYGPAKGCRMGIPSYAEYENICFAVEANVTEGDKVCIIDNSNASSYGYLCSRGEYAVYSPQGGHGTGLNDTIVEYYEENPQKSPTVVLIRLSYIEQSIEEYICDTSFGQYLEKNGYKKVSSDGEYVVFRRETLLDSGL